MRDFVNGGGEWIRTTEVVDNRFTVCPLWPLGNSPINYAILYKACPAFLSGRTAQFGAGERTRTPDLLITNQLLYQLSYTSEFFSARLLYPNQRRKSRGISAFFAIFLEEILRIKNGGGSAAPISGLFRRKREKDRNIRSFSFFWGGVILKSAALCRKLVRLAEYGYIIVGKRASCQCF